MNAFWQDQAARTDEIARLTRALAAAQAEIERLRDLFRIDGEQHAERIRQLTAAHELRINKYADALAASRAEVERLRHAAALALDEMCNTVAPRNSFTDAVDALDAALSPKEKP